MEKSEKIYTTHSWIAPGRPSSPHPVLPQKIFKYPLKKLHAKIAIFDYSTSPHFAPQYPSEAHHRPHVKIKTLIISHLHFLNLFISLIKSKLDFLLYYYTKQKLDFHIGF